MQINNPPEDDWKQTGSKFKVLLLLTGPPMQRKLTMQQEKNKKDHKKIKALWSLIMPV